MIAYACDAVIIRFGEVAEWTKAAVLKTVGGQPPGGSNPSLSATVIFFLSGSAFNQIIMRQS